MQYVLPISTSSQQFLTLVLDQTQVLIFVKIFVYVTCRTRASEDRLTPF